MKIRSALSAAATLPAFTLALACGGGSSAPPSVTCTDGHMVAAEANDYAFTSKITLPPVTVKSMTNLTFDWSGVTKDFQGHTVTAADLNTIVVMLWTKPLNTLQDLLNADTLKTMDLVQSPPPSIILDGTKTSVSLYDFTVNGMPITQDVFNGYFDPAMYPSANFSYIVALQTGTDLGRGIRMIQAFKLDAASTATTVTMTNSSTMLQYHADLHSLNPTGVPAGTAALTLDWGPPQSTLATNALGATFTPTEITNAIVGHYTQSPSELEGKFLDLELIATNLYRAAIDTGTTLDFSMLKDSANNAFPGIDDSGTWLVGLQCGNCRNPAPWYMTILKPCTKM